MTRLTEFVLHHRRWVMVFWLLSLAIGVFAAGRTSSRLSVDFSLPGQPGYETEKQILAIYHNGGSNQPTIPVVTVPEGTTVAAQQAKITAVFDQIQAALPGVRIVDYAQTSDPVFLTKDGRTTYALVYPTPFQSFSDVGPDVAMRPILEKATRDTGFDWKVTGYNLLAQGSEDPQGPSLLTETLLGGLGALAVLVFVFASFLAFLPLVIAAVSILTTFSIVLLATYVTDISFVVQFLIALIGLGVAVDYSLLVVNRWREERAHGRDNHDAVVVAMQTAGHAVVASAGTVAISLCALLVIPVPLLRSMGIGGMLIPLVSTLVILTLLPALLGGAGPRIDWPKIRHEGAPSRAWSAWARLVVRHRWVAAGIATAILAALIVPVFGIKIGQAQTDSLARGGPAYESLQTLKKGGVPAGIVSPLEILVKSADPAGTAVKAVVVAKGVDGVAAAFAPDNGHWRKDGTAMVGVIPVRELVDSDNAQVAARLDQALKRVPGVVGVAGAGATVLDYISAVYKKFPYSLGLIALVTFILLVRTFRSLVLPLKAVILNVISVSATFGATVLFWQQGHGSEQIFGIHGTGAVTFWLPVLIFAFLFGLSMDYEVFILARMREAYDKTGDTDAAVVEGLARTGRLVTGAAMILFLSFVALTASPGTDIKVFASALGIGILLDATIVRALLVPALVSLFGRWNWWLPAWVARPLLVRPHAAIPEPRRPVRDLDHDDSLIG
ncbi:MAG: putative drug exporter of the superfamily [Actinomycetota bacterium]|jgi:RND superfamily putative drug exporter|nr:putative drug exporter of the superfamily [Actinomycetota bacterium]